MAEPEVHRHRSATPQLIPLVDRHEELGSLRQAMRAVAAGLGSTIYISGEVGSGKTRLAHETVSMAREFGFAAAFGDGSVAGDSSLWPWQSMLVQLGCASAAERLGRCRQAGEQFHRSISFRTVVGALTSAASVSPIVIVVDNAHAANLGALMLTRFAVRSLRAVPILVVITACETDDLDEPARSLLDDIRREAVFLRPKRLSRRSLEALMSVSDSVTSATSVTSVTSVISADEVDCVESLTRGNPRLVDELLTSTGPTMPFAGPLRAMAESLNRAKGRVSDEVSRSLAAAVIRRTPAALGEAVQAVRAASARLDIDRDSASQLLERLVALYDDAGLAPPVELLLDAAHTDLSAGRLRAARAWFRRAAQSATDPRSFATAALGFGGLWVREHRHTADHASLMAMLDHAIAWLPDDERTLNARLTCRRVVELAYSGMASLADVQQATAHACSVGDPNAAAEALSLLHHSMLGPASAHDRGPVAEELLRRATAAGSDLFTMMAMMWRTVDLTLLGDGRAEWALHELRHRADSQEVGAIMFVAAALDVMWRIRRGELDDAVGAAERCFEIGDSVGDHDAVGYLGAHMLTIRWLQWRPDEMLPMVRHIAESNWNVDGDLARPAAVAILASMAGELDEARAALAVVMDATVRGSDRSSDWLVAMFCAAETASVLDDEVTAREIYTRLTPYGHLPIMASLGVVCFGSAERPLGLVARTYGDLDVAVRHFERAVTHNRTLGNAVMSAISEGDLGQTLLARAGLDDAPANGVTRDAVDRGRALVESSVETLRLLGLHERADRLRITTERADELADELDVPTTGEIVCRGSSWELRAGHHVAQLTDTVGLQRLLMLLERPYVEVAAADLVGGVAASARYDMADMSSLRAYNDRVRELRSEIDEAELDADIARASRLGDELEFILEHLAGVAGLAGASRAFPDNQERARIAVRKSLSRVFDEVSTQSPEFAEGLASSVRTGAKCSYHPCERMPHLWRRRDRTSR